MESSSFTVEFPEHLPHEKAVLPRSTRRCWRVDRTGRRTGFL